MINECGTVDGMKRKPKYLEKVCHRSHLTYGTAIKSAWTITKENPERFEVLMVMSTDSVTNPFTWQVKFPVCHCRAL
jgi:hypothetical protein